MLNAEGLPPCTADESTFPRIDLGIGLRGCYGEKANVYLADSVLNLFSGLPASIDPLLKSVDDILLAQLNIDVGNRDLPAIHLVYGSAELELIKEHVNFMSGGAGWYECCVEGPRIYIRMDAFTWEMEGLVHEYVHYALDRRMHLTTWINEGLAEYYSLEAYPFNPTAELYFDAREASIYCLLGHLTPLTRMEYGLSKEREFALVQYAQAHMAIRYIIDLGGHEAVSQILELLYSGSDVSTALDQTLGKSYPEFESDFVGWVLAWGENAPTYQAFVNGNGGPLFCFTKCLRRVMTIGVSVVEFSAEVTFTNPTATDFFEYGFSFGKTIQVSITSEGIWRAFAWTWDGLHGSAIREYTPRGRVDVPLDTGLGGSNQLRLTVVGDQGCLYVNGESVSCFALPAQSVVAGGVGVFSRHGDVWHTGFNVEPVN